MNIDVSGLTIYPVKSLRSISLIESQVEPAGLRFDRRFMLVDEHGQFLNLRKLGKLLEFATKIEDETLIIQHGSADSIDFPLEQSPIQEHGSRSVVVWNSKLEASTVSRKVDEWFSRILGIKAGLVFMADFSKRPINSRFDRGSDLVSFADGYPILIVRTLSTECRGKRRRGFSGGQMEKDTDWKFCLESNQTVCPMRCYNA
jgi:uncharacterized protein YcbX